MSWQGVGVVGGVAGGVVVMHSLVLHCLVLTGDVCQEQKGEGTLVPF